MLRARLRSVGVALLCGVAVTLSLAGGPASAHIRSLPPQSAPTFGTIYGRFFPNPTDSGPFTVTPSTPVSFTQQFPVILFNPPPDANVHCTPPLTAAVNEAARPMVDVIPQPDGSCATAVVAGNGYQAGVGPLFRFEAVFLSTVTVAAAGTPPSACSRTTAGPWLSVPTPRGASPPMSPGVATTRRPRVPSRGIPWSGRTTTTRM